MSYSVTNAHPARTAAVTHAIHETRSTTRRVSMRTGLTNERAARMRLHTIAERIGRE